MGPWIIILIFIILIIYPFNVIFNGETFHGGIFIASLVCWVGLIISILSANDNNKS